MKTLIFTGELTTRTALHVGGGRASPTADSILRRTASGEIVIPGSALGGALRALATRLAPRLDGQRCWALWSQPEQKEYDTAFARLQQMFERRRQRNPAVVVPALRACQCATCHLFGSVNPQAQNTEEGGRAARLWVYDATLTQVGAATTIRDGVGIDRRSGVAARAEAVKFDLEALPAGSTFRFRLELENPSGLDETLLAAVLAEWCAGRGNVGGRVGRGFGAVKLNGLQVYTQDLNDGPTLMSFLRDDEPTAGRTLNAGWIAAGVERARAALDPFVDSAGADEDVEALWLKHSQWTGAQHYVAHSWLELELTLQATGPFLANDVTRAGRSGFDHAPLVEERPILPGASLRGVLRSHAERIARTLAASRIRSDDPQAAATFWRKCPACSPLARPVSRLKPLPDLDGSAQQPAPADNKPVVPLLVCDERGLKARPEDEVDEAKLCLACRLFGSTELGSRLLIEDACLVGDKADYKAQDFLAIDRFTGGGRDSAKFDAAVLWRPAFAARLRLDNPHPWELGWLALILRDLAEGWLTLGFGRAKGYGQVVIPRWTVRIGRLKADDFPAALPAPTPSKTPSVYDIFEFSGGAVDEQGQVAWRVSGVDATAWRDQVAAWVQVFNQQVQDFEVKTELPQNAVDTYFGESVQALYPMVEGGAHAS